MEGIQNSYKETANGKRKKGNKKYKEKTDETLRNIIGNVSKVTATIKSPEKCLLL